MRTLRAFIVALMLCAVSYAAPAADECGAQAWVPRTEECFGFGLWIHLRMFEQGIDQALQDANQPAFYAKVVVVRRGRGGTRSDAFVSAEPPPGMEDDAFVSRYIFVTTDYLAERSGLAVLQHAALVQLYSTDYLHAGEPQSATERERRRLTVERYVFRAMSQRHYLEAAQAEAELGDPFFVPMRGMPYQELRNALQQKFARSNE